MKRLLLLIICLLPLTGWGAEATATLKLEELLKLRQASQASQQTVKPPAGVTIEEAIFSGRLLEAGISLKANFTVSVLGKDWVKAALLTVDENTHITRLPKIEDAYFLLKDDHLYFITNKPKRFQFDLAFLKSAGTKENRRSASFSSPAALSKLQLSVDREHFQLLNQSALVNGSRITLFPTNHQYLIKWTMKSSKPRAAQPKAQKQAREPVVDKAYASLVAPLSGKRILRIYYQLQLSGARPLSINVPSALRVKHLYLNGTAIVPTVTENKLNLTVSPAQTGDNHANLELVLIQDKKSYLLSGDLYYRLPAISWTVNHYHLSLHLPKVFNYHWKGGSFAPGDSSQQQPEFRYHIPTPGKQIQLKQQLVYGHPDARIHYKVDLDKRYFKTDLNNFNERRGYTAY